MSLSSRSRSATPSTAASDSPIPSKFILIANSAAATSTLLDAVFSLEFDPEAPVVLGLCVSLVNKTSDPAEIKEAFLVRAQALLAASDLWKDNGAWDKQVCQFEDKNVVYFIYSDRKCTSDNEHPYVDEDEGHCKHTPSSLLHTFAQASLRSVIAIPSTDGAYAFHVLERPAFVFPPLTPTLGLPSSPDASTAASTPWGVPTQDEWRGLWRAWDLVTLQMIPQEMLLQKPIDLRHKCLFYIGHIPTFVDMLLSKAIGGRPSEPKYFWDIFERGIDPHVDDPDHCHNHSAVPEADADWPSLAAVLAFRDRVRARLFRLYAELEGGTRPLTRNVARTLVMTHEHEGFHVETLLYMLIQRAGSGTLPPPGFTTPPWALLSAQWDAAPPPSSPSVILGPAPVVLGHDDSEADDALPAHAGHVFGWDNESPARTVLVGPFRAAWRPVSNREYAAFLRAGGAGGVPKSWVVQDGEIAVRTLYGAVPMDVAQHWPVLASYDDLTAYAHAQGGRLPTEPELRLFLDTYDVGHAGGANVGFRNWHPVPATTGRAEDAGRGSNGGVWEWTTTAFASHAGLVPTDIFTGYSADFFDAKHQVVLGASYATIPRIAGRRTVRNFYQHNYPYAWVGGRVVYDV